VGFDPTLKTLDRVRDNRAATTAPTASDDETQGYAPGSIWIDTVGHIAYHCVQAAAGAAVWAGVRYYDPGEVATIAAYGKIAPGEHALGTVLNYQKTGSYSASKIQYTRVWLVEGLTMDRMACYVVSGANGARDLRMGVYEQADPLDPVGAPTNRVAQTNAFAPAVNGWARPQLTNAPTGGSGTPVTWEPSTGYYWAAFITDETALQFEVSDPYPAGFATVWRETGAGVTLPAAAGTLTNPTSAIGYVAVMEQ